MMKSNSGHPKAPKSKPRWMPNAKYNLKSLSLPETKNKMRASSDHIRQAGVQNQLTEDGPNVFVREKTNQFRKFLDNLWGPIRG